MRSIVIEDGRSFGILLFRIDCRAATVSFRPSARACVPLLRRTYLINSAGFIEWRAHLHLHGQEGNPSFDFKRT